MQSEFLEIFDCNGKKIVCRADFLEIFDFAMKVKSAKSSFLKCILWVFTFAVALRAFCLISRLNKMITFALV